jgi:hypothetical protein
MSAVKGSARQHSPPEAESMTNADRHHVPPRKPDAKPRFIKRKDSRHHRAYHLLFAAAKSYDDACLILWHDWWEQGANDLTCQYPDTPERMPSHRHEAPNETRI